MSSQVKLPGSAKDAHTGSGTDTGWINQANIETADNNFATCAMGPADSEYLIGFNFGFTIPGGATINGIQVEISREDVNHQFGSTTADIIVKLRKADVAVGTGVSNGVTWPTANTIQTYGSISDLWGTTWTPSDINDTNFGVQMACQGDGFTGSDPRVDFYRITVTYTASGAVNTSRMFQMF